MVTEKTPLPWCVSSSFIICDAEAHILANCLHTGIPALDVPFDARIANAAFIVKACNCHDELITALNVCKSYLRHSSDSGKAHTLALDVVSMALAKAEAGQESEK